MISIILPTYQRAAYLDRCIASVVNQTYKNWELIVVDDGSQDSTFAVVKAWVDHDPRISYCYHRNQGAGLARNLGLRFAQGDYITFIDSDDCYLPEHLYSRWQWLQDHPEVDLIQGGLLLPEEVWVRDYYHPDQWINLRECVVCPTFFGKRQVFEVLGGFRPLPYGEDTDLWERASQQFRVMSLRDPETYVYTRAENSTTRQWPPEQLFSQNVLG